jgi:chromosome segregation ATPase
MYSKSQKTKKTSVKLFITTVSTVIMFSSPSIAKTDDEVKDAYPKNRECRDYRNDITNAKNDLSKLCKDAGAGSSCADKVDACSSEAGSTGSVNLYSTAATALGGSNSSLGTALGAMGQSSSASNSCPQYSFQDYFTKKDKYTDDLDKTEEDLAALSDEKAQVQEDFNKEIADLQEDLDKAQQDLQDKKREIAEKKRKATSEFQEVQNKVKDDLRSQSTTLLDLQGKLISTQRDKALNLVALTEASAKRACTKAVQDQKTQAQKDGALSGLASGTMITKAKRLKEDLINTWNDCMTVYDQKRQALMETSKQNEDAIRKQIQDTTESMAQTQDSLNAAQTQLTEITTEATTEQSEAEANLTKTMQNIQNKMTAAKQKLEQKLQTIATKTTTYTEKINRLNTSISQLGVAPPSGSTTTISAISDELQSKQEEIKTLEGYATEACGTGTASTSKSPSSGRQ